MRKYFLAALLLLVMNGNLSAAQSETIVSLKTNNGTLEGTLLVPMQSDNIPVALIIAGSGPTDRNGNNPAMQNNSLKMLATELLKNGIATLRYDKRGIGRSRNAGNNESDLRFEHYISDAKDWIAWLNKDKRFSKIIVIGHSEGSLLGMVASQENEVDQFVSIAGPGRSADKTIVEQLKSQPPEVLKMSLPIIDKLKQGETVSNVNPVLFSLFRPSVQPYMISWFRYDPPKEIAKLKIPVLIIQGSTDIQVSVEDAKLLAEANQNAELEIITGMNHIFKEATLDPMMNFQTYNQPELPIKPELVKITITFIGKSDIGAGAGK
jgi:hypothetical protein